jgi:hypothetical protein
MARTSTSALIVIAVLLLAPTRAAAQAAPEQPRAATGQPAAAQPPAAEAAPRTPWGTPDLGGIWDFRTITPLERPEEYGDRAFLTEPSRPGR